MSDAIIKRGISLEPVRPALFSFVIDDDMFNVVLEEISILQTRYGKSLAEAIEIVDRSHNGERLEMHSWRNTETPLYWMRTAMEGPDFWKNDREQGSGQSA